MGVTAGQYLGIPFADRESEGAALREQVLKLHRDKVPKAVIVQATGKSPLTIRGIIQADGRLTKEELCVLRLCQKFSQAEVAIMRGVKVGCIKTQLNHVYRFFGLKGSGNKCEAAYELAVDGGHYEEPKIDYDAEPEVGKEYDFYLDRALQLKWTEERFRVLWELSFGMTSGDIAAKRGVSPAAIRHQRQQIAKTFGVKGALQCKILHRAVEHKMLPAIGKTEGWEFPLDPSPLELEVLTLVGEGLEYAQIGSRFGESGGYIHHLMCGVSRRLKEMTGYSGALTNFKLYVLAVRSGLIGPIEAKSKEAA